MTFLELRYIARTGHDYNGKAYTKYVLQQRTRARQDFAEGSVLASLAKVVDKERDTAPSMYTPWEDVPFDPDGC